MLAWTVTCASNLRPPRRLSVAVRLLALDLDGTIVNSELRISECVRHAVGQAIAAGVHVTLAAGRYFRGGHRAPCSGGTP